VASVLALIFLFLNEAFGVGAYYIEGFAGYRFSILITRGIYIVSWWFFGVFIYHTIHQLALINRIYTKHTQIDLFKMKPLYGFSNLAALTAGSLLLLPYGFLLINPVVQLTDPVILVIYLVISLIAMITFLLPQLGIHRLQREEKERLIGEINQRYKTSMTEMHKRVDEGKYDSVSEIIVTQNALTSERKIIRGISTWPWQPETLRWLFTAMVLPLILWIIQNFLGQWLGQ
jgi:hypothetical protein